MKNAIVWHRRDLRIDDNTALHQAIFEGYKPVGVFIFDPVLLAGLPPNDPRITFIVESLNELSQNYRKLGCLFIIVKGAPQLCIPELCKLHIINKVYFNEDYELFAKIRDDAVQEILKKQGIESTKYKDHVIFTSNEILTGTNRQYTIFTPYKNAWMKKINESPPTLQQTAQLLKKKRFTPIPDALFSIEEIGFLTSKITDISCGEKGALAQAKKFALAIDSYAQTRDIPSLPGTSKLGVHLRFGTISIRKLVSWSMHLVGESAKCWLSELIWRDFYSAILNENPRLTAGEAFQSNYNQMSWSNKPKFIEAWKNGTTGYPIVDAGMRELNATAHMHNRVRMIAASFLVKHLDCDWRIGEKYFAEKLLDFEFASNNGGWQWCASTGSDAQPYFRIFNPYLQSEKFDKDGEYIKRWVPELINCPLKYIHSPHLTPTDTLSTLGLKLPQNYPLPLVDHKTARLVALHKYSTESEKLSSDQ